MIMMSVDQLHWGLDHHINNDTMDKVEEKEDLMRLIHAYWGHEVRKEEKEKNIQENVVHWRNKCMFLLSCNILDSLIL